MKPVGEEHPAAGLHAMRVAVTTVPSLELGESLARAAVEARLAACAQVDGAPIHSTYRWQGQVQTEPEFRVSFKILATQEPALRALVQGRHPYDTPQWVVFEASASAAYAAWLRAEAPAGKAASEAATTPPGASRAVEMPGPSSLPSQRICDHCGATVAREHCHRNRYHEYICADCLARGVRWTSHHRFRRWMGRHRLALLVGLAGTALLAAGWFWRAGA